jgi:predicted alpha/beta superfamily hydrolase
MIGTFPWAIALFTALWTSSVAAEAPTPLATMVPSQPWALQFNLKSKLTGRTYRIYVHRPDSPPSPRGYPAILFTDGNVSFPIATIAGLFAEVEGRGNALIVGIGYPSDDLKSLTVMRNRDLTPTQPPGQIQQYPGYPTMTANDFGGSELFYRFLVEELRPQLAKLYAIDPDNQTLAGHSLGGMFTLSVLFRHPTAFRNYVAMSPALWWDNRSLLAEEPAITRLIADRKLAPRLLITVGEQVYDIPASLAP